MHRPHALAVLYERDALTAEGCSDVELVGQTPSSAGVHVWHAQLSAPLRTLYSVDAKPEIWSARAVAGITRQQQKRLKELCGRPVPKDYLDLLRRFPTELAHQLAARQPQADERLLFTDVATVIAQNDEVRTEDIWTEEGPWPPGHLLIGAEDGGDKWLLNVADRKIYRLLHESGTLDVRAASLQDWLEAVSKYLGGDARALDGAQPTPNKGQPVLPKPVNTKQANIQKFMGGWLERSDKAKAKAPDDPEGWKERASLLGRMLDAEDGDGERDFIGVYRLFFDSIDALADATLTAHEDWLRVATAADSTVSSAEYGLRRAKDAHARRLAGDVEARRSLLRERFEATKDDYYQKELDKLP